MSFTTDVEPEAYVVSEVVPLTNALRALQDTDGCIMGDTARAGELLERLRIVVSRAYTLVEAPDMLAASFNADVDRWLSRGLSTPPVFDHTLQNYCFPQAGALTFFIAPLKLPNGPTPSQTRLECFLARRQEPEELEELNRIFYQQPDKPLQRQSCRLLTGSEGWMEGNCYVFFPENVSTLEKTTSQHFALSFSNKFERIFRTETLPRASTVFQPQVWFASRLSSSDFYRVHCMWSYLHDHFHQCGPRPLDKHLRVKMNFFVGLLEEIKVDSQAVAACYEKSLPFGREITEFIIGERLLRYPNQPRATSNFDAGSGMLLFEWLFKQGDGLYQQGHSLVIDIDACVASMAQLAEEIEAIELNEDDMHYKSQAKAFVRKFLPANQNGERFAIPSNYLQWIYKRVTTTATPSL